MLNPIVKTAALSIAAVITLGASAVAPAAMRSVSLSQEPLVIRLSNDEFRIAFGINAEPVFQKGCDGAIHYRVFWKTESGAVRSETKVVNYTVSPSTSRTIAVDRQYFDFAEGAHTTEVTKVSVDKITCTEGAGSHAI